MFIPLGIAITAVIMVVNASARFSNGDSLVPVLMSLYHWTPFYWGSAHYGMLIPLLAAPISNPLWNLIFQNLAGAGALLAAPLLIARFVYGREHGLVIGSCVSILALMLYGDGPLMFAFASPAQGCWAVALALCYGGLCLMGSASMRSICVPTGCLLILAAMWVSPTSAFSALPLIVMTRVVSVAYKNGRTPTHFVLSARMKPLWQAASMCAAVIVAIALSVGATRIASPSEGQKIVALLSRKEWVENHGVERLIHGFFNWYINPFPASLAVIIALYAVGILILTTSHSSIQERIVKSSAALLAALVSEPLILSDTRYIAGNDFDGHYLFAPLLLVLILPIGMILFPLLENRSVRSRLLPLCSTVLVVTALANYGWPSMTKLRTGLDDCCGRYSEEIRTLGVTHFAGTYWVVWPAEFHVNWREYEAGSKRRVWALSLRSEPTRPYWDNFDSHSARIAAPLGDGNAMSYLDSFGIHVISGQAHKTIVTYEYSLSKFPLPPPASR